MKLTEHGDELGADLRQWEMTRKHDHIKNCFFSLMKWMGYPAIMEAKGLFRAYAKCIDNNPDVQNDPKLGEIIQPFELYEQFSPWGTVLYFDRMIPPE